MKRLLLIFLLCLPFSGYADVDSREFKDPALQETYSTIKSELRCLVCQNQTIADSNAELADDLRRQVYEMLQQGKSSQEILDFMTERYGDFVLYKPAFKAKTGFLWLGPVVFLLLGLTAILFIFKRKKTAPLETDVERSQKLAKAHALLVAEESKSTEELS